MSTAQFDPSECVARRLLPLQDIKSPLHPRSNVSANVRLVVETPHSLNVQTPLTSLSCLAVSSGFVQC